MKTLGSLLLMLFAGGLSLSLAFAEGNAENGKKLFNDPALGGSTNKRSCNTCHPGGNGLEEAGTKTFYSVMGFKTSDLEDIVNLCIEKPLKGKGLDKNSQEMQDIVAYISSLGEKE